MGTHGCAPSKKRKQLCRFMFKYHMGNRTIIVATTTTTVFYVLYGWRWQP